MIMPHLISLVRRAERLDDIKSSLFLIDTYILLHCPPFQRTHQCKNKVQFQNSISRYDHIVPGPSSLCYAPSPDNYIRCIVVQYPSQSSHPSIYACLLRPVLTHCEYSQMIHAQATTKLNNMRKDQRKIVMVQDKGVWQTRKICDSVFRD
jgi:hypothetical protein